MTKTEKYSIRHTTPNKETTNRKYRDIMKRYKELKSFEVEGMKLKHADIVNKIAYEFYMSSFSVGLVIQRNDV